MTISVRATAKNAALDAELANITLFRVYDGTQPATPETALGGGNHQLAELPATPGAASAGASTIVLVDDTDADASGTVTFGSLCKADGTRQADIPVADLGLDTDAVLAHGLFRGGSFVYNHG